MKFEIKSYWTGKLLFEWEGGSIRLALEAAVEKKIDLTGADLKGADLTGAYLKGAYLKGADLTGADLTGADLTGAYLKGADLTGAYLKGADLTGAYLKGADLTGADLKGADLTDIKADFFKILEVARAEALGLYDAVMRGLIDGSAYQGECACLVGTIANVRHENYEKLTINLRPDSGRPAEKWFLAIRRGDIPQNNAVSDVTAGWLREFLDANGIKYPKYEIKAIS